MVVHVVTGANRAGVKFSATETPYLGQQPEPMESFMDDVKLRPGATVSDVRHETKDDEEILSFSLTDPKDGYNFRMVRANSIQYMQVIQFPQAQSDKASGMKDDFFASFRITRP